MRMELKDVPYVLNILHILAVKIHFLSLQVQKVILSAQTGLENLKWCAQYVLYKLVLQKSSSHLRVRGWPWGAAVCTSVVVQFQTHRLLVFVHLFTLFSQWFSIHVTASGYVVLCVNSDHLYAKDIIHVQEGHICNIYSLSFSPSL